MNNNTDRFERLVKSMYNCHEISTDDLYKFFEITHNETSFYKITGNVDRLITFMDVELINNVNGLKAFLEFQSTEMPHNVYEHITEFLG